MRDYSKPQARGQTFPVTGLMPAAAPRSILRITRQGVSLNAVVYNAAGRPGHHGTSASKLKRAGRP